MADANEEAAASRVYDTLAPATDRVSNVRDASDPAGDVTTGMIWAASPPPAAPSPPASPPLADGAGLTSLSLTA